jgi:hypothetical protein
VVKVEVRVDDMRDVGGSHADQAQLVGKVLGWSSTQRERACYALSKPTDRVLLRVAVNSSVEENDTTAVSDQEAGNLDRHLLARRFVWEEERPIELEPATTHSVLSPK